MLQQRDDAGHCRPEVTARADRDAAAEDRATYRRWSIITVVFYSAFLLIFSMLAVAHDRNAGVSLAKLLAPTSISHARTNSGTN